MALSRSGGPIISFWLGTVCNFVEMGLGTSGCIVGTKNPKGRRTESNIFSYSICQICKSESAYYSWKKRPDKTSETKPKQLVCVSWTPGFWSILFTFCRFWNETSSVRNILIFIKKSCITVFPWCFLGDDEG